MEIDLEAQVPNKAEAGCIQVQHVEVMSLVLSNLVPEYYRDLQPPGPTLASGQAFYDHEN